MGNLWFELTGEYYKSVKKLESTEAVDKLYKNLHERLDEEKERLT